MCTYSFHGYFVFFLVITLDNHDRPKKDDKFFQLYISAGTYPSDHVYICKNHSK